MLFIKDYKNINIASAMSFALSVRAKDPSLHNRLSCEVANNLICKSLIHNN